MNTVIGYKGSQTDRFDAWHAMLHYRSGKEVFSRPTDEWETDRLMRDTKNYANHLGSYVA